MNQAPAGTQLAQQGLALFRQGRLAEAAGLFRQLLSQQPANVDAMQMLGLVEQQAGRPQAALSLFEQAVAIAPRHAMLNFNRGLVLFQLARLEHAVAAYDTALEAEPRYTKAHLMRGSTLYALERYQEALGSFEQVLQLEADHADALANLGCTLIRLAREAEALKALDRSIALNGSLADSHFNRGVALASLGRHKEAIASYEHALAISPGLVDAIRSRGVALGHLKQFPQAIAEFERALQLNPAHAPTWLDLANALADAGGLEEAAAAYERALASDPALDFAFDALLHTKMKMCDWRDFDANLARLEASIGGKILSSPSRLLPVSGSARLQKVCAELYADLKYPAAAPLAAHAPQDSKIRIGYFSSDFFGHATAFLLAGVFERHDRSRFRTVAFSYGSPPQDDMHRRLRCAFDEFIDVGAMTDSEVASLARAKGIDIAVDLKGLTQHGRPRIFAMRAAPVQVSYLGYPCTMGSRALDYLIADATVVPQAQCHHYSEQVVWLPSSYQANDATRVISDRVFTRMELGLPEHGFVFCSFNNPYKITPAVFGVWMKLLQRVDGSVLWLLAGTPVAVANLRSQAQARGIDPGRIVFASYMDPADHLARHEAADVFLDTAPCNAHTTASDALWAGLPIVTCAGGAFAGRVAASLLGAVGLQELVTDSLESYEQLAFELASAPARLARLRDQLVSRRHEQPLFDTARKTRELEAAYEHIHERARCGLGPEHFSVGDLGRRH